MKDIILFDVDGVLLNTMSVWANSANEYLKEVHGILARESLDTECTTMSLLESGEYICGLYPELNMTARKLADGVAEFIRERYWKAQPMPKMTETVHWLKKQGHTLYLATASDEINVKGALSNLGVWDCFTDIYTCTAIGYSKNYVEYYEEVAKRIGVTTNALTLVEDSLHSIVTAKRAGLFVIGIYEESSADKADEICKICDVYLSRLDDIKKIVS